MPNPYSAAPGSRAATPATAPFLPAGLIRRGGPEPWSDIDPSLIDEDGGGSAPAFPLDLLPLPWRAWVADTARAVGAPADYVVQSLLAAVAGACGTGVAVRVTPAWSEPLGLSVALIGRRSSGKSPALAPAHGLLMRLEAELKQSDPERAPRIVLGEPALNAAAVSRALTARPQGVLLWRDDSAPWLADLPEPAAAGVSVLGSLRPEALIQALIQALAAEGDDGFAARFLFAWPDPPPYCRLVDRRVPDNEQAFGLLRRLMRIAGTPDTPLVLAFDDAAVKAFDAFLAALHVALRTAEGLEADWMGKGSGTVARLAGILALLTWVGSDAGGTPSRVDAASVETAARLWNDYFHPHASLVFDRAAPTDLKRQARRVVRWLLANRRTEVTREDVRRHALCRAVNAANADTVIGRLHAGGVLRPVHVAAPPQGGRLRQLYEVNPALASAT